MSEKPHPDEGTIREPGVIGTVVVDHEDKGVFVIFGGRAFELFAAASSIGSFCALLGYYGYL